MNVILLGPPGAGKGTQAEFLQQRFNLAALSTGNMLRAAIAAGSDLGIQADAYMKRGELVPDALVIDLLLNAMQVDYVGGGFLLDGFPRTRSQAEALMARNIKIDYVVEIRVPDAVIVERMSGRLWHPGSGRTYHAVSKPPQNPGCDDITGEPLEVRDDDKPATVQNRLKIYHETTGEVALFYADLAARDKAVDFFQVDGTLPICTVQESIVSIINR